MDPIAHTLVGASLAETPLKRLSTLATPTLSLGANAPDIDAVTLLLSRDASLGFRRGWTHGILAMVILPLFLAGLMLLFDRLLGRYRQHQPRARAGPLIALSYIGVLTHTPLDWLNTYGIRFLMQFDGRWFYGDALFIVDPWIWLLAGAAVVLAHTRTVAAIAAWLALGAVLTVLVTGVALAPTPARLLWVAGVATIVGVRTWGDSQTRLPHHVATLCLACAAAYIVAMVAGSRVAERQVTEWLAHRGTVPIEIMASPLPANPFARGIVVTDQQHYHFLDVNWLRAERFRISRPAIDRGPGGPVVEAALRAPHVQGLTTWIRFSAYTVEELPDGYRVTIRDARYAGRGVAGLGNAVIELDRDLRLRPRPSPPAATD